ncbi:hypothetical protein [Pseudoxanthomonas sacheonensis]|uniref:YD repeat-containing protein n=1 Tax=Pseudoxanthomonas sacheonensis TaxID=443615 RepID=A0ABU1RNS8_9GAMM|nr:hypothetical protein [Pseudoxanthomonas sacheonensis]MDR6840427.1 YD repeat-containing protein [Pseudoxanthomonas sacheonensis]
MKVGLLLLGSLALVSLQAGAVEPYQEYNKRIESAQNITALNDQLMGDSVSLYNGATEFSATDIDLPGNDSLPVRLGRRLSIELNPAGNGGGFDSSLGGAGNWDVEVPSISSTYAGSSDWAPDRCSVGGAPSMGGFEPTDFWRGNSIHIPGGGDRTMLLMAAGVPQPSDGVPRKWTTRERDMFTCIPMQSGLAGEGFLMQTTSGVRYYFDIAVSRSLGYMTRNVEGFPNPFTVSRVKYYLLASKIQDRFGNTVTFQYDANGHPTSITGSDGRLITLAYSGALLTSASANGRTWQYQYGAGVDAGKLTAVVQPDSSKWQFAYIGTLKPDYEPWDGGSNASCSLKPPAIAASFGLNITHPSGAVGDFQFANKRHYRAGLHASECLPRVNAGTTYYILHTPNYFDVMSLQSKSISGPGLAQPMVWTYDYGISNQALWGSAGTAAPYPCTTCATEKLVTVTNPDATRREYRYGFLYALNEGRLLGSSVLDAGGMVRRTESTAYISEAQVAAQNFFTLYGYIINGDDPSTAAVRPVISQTIQQDGVTFSMQVNTACTGGSTVYCFDIYGNTTSVTKSSSLGFTRSETTVYAHDPVKWLLGQVAQTAIDGIIASETTYDSAYALPLQTKSFGKVKQVLTYNLTAGSDQLGTVATVKDGNNNTTTLSNWKRGTPQLIQHPATPDQPGGTSLSAVVDANGWIGSVTNEAASKTCYTYDTMGRVASVTYPSETAANTCDSSAWEITTQSFQQIASSEYGIPANHWKQTISTGNGRKVVYFDAFWRPLVEEAYDIADAANTRSLVVKRYDTSGQLAFQGYPLRTLSDYASSSLVGATTIYDALGRATSFTQASEIGPLTTTTLYDSGFKTVVTDPRNFQTTTEFQVFDQPTTDAPTKIVSPEDTITEIGRDVFGKPTYLRRRNTANTISSTRRYVYNGNQELCKTIEPETASTVMHYDLGGNLDWSASGQDLPSTTECNTDVVPVAQIVTRSYDARNRVKTLVFPDNLGNTATSYTPEGQVASVLVNNGGSDLVTSDYVYKRRGSLASERLRLGTNDWSLGYAYNRNGHLATLTYPDSLSVGFAPNALGQPKQAGGYALGVNYHPNGGMSGFTYGNGIVHTMTQNTRQLPERSLDSGDVLDDSYDYDQVGNVAAISDGLPGNRGNRDMTYDGLNRLLTTVSPMFVGGTLYTYDALDNLTRVKAPGRDHIYNYDNKWRLQAVTVGAATVIALDYDTHGNLNNKNGQLFVFDTGNRLRQATGQETYQYDGAGRRVKATNASQASIYSFYGQDGALRFQRDERQGKTTDYIMLNGSLVARVSNVVSPAVPTVSAPGFVSTGSYTVSWTAVAGASRYELQERVNSGSWSQVYSGTALSQAFTGKVSGVYGYQARACNPSACGAWSAEASVSVTLPPSSVPTISVPATAPGGDYTVSWTASTGATSYTLDQSTNGGSTWATAYTGAAQSVPYVDKPAGNYTYRVKGCNSAGCSAYSANATVQSIQPPSGTSTVTAPASNSTGSYTVSWTAVATATTYTLEEQVNGGGWTAFGANAGTSTAISGRANGTYGYRVKGCNSAGCGPVSAVVSVVVLYPPTTPALSVPSSSNTGNYTVSWTAPGTTTSYQIEQSANGGAWAAFYTGAATSAAATGRATGSYAYRGRACNASGCSGNSATVTIAVALAPAAAPTLTAPASTTTGSFTVSWTTVTDAATYSLEERLNGGSWSVIYSNTGTSSALTNRTPGTWDYRVKGCNSVGCGPTSAVSTVTSSAPPAPAAPTGLQAVPNGVGCNISWNASAGATYYELKKTFTLYSGPATSYSYDAACPTGLKVRACNASTCSVWVP